MSRAEAPVDPAEAARRAAFAEDLTKRLRAIADPIAESCGPGVAFVFLLSEAGSIASATNLGTAECGELLASHLQRLMAAAGAEAAETAAAGGPPPTKAAGVIDGSGHYEPGPEFVALAKSVITSGSMNGAEAMALGVAIVSIAIASAPDQHKRKFASAVAKTISAIGGPVLVTGGGLQ